MPKVFLVTSGSYSDYHVVGVFSTRENAERVINDADKSDYDSAYIEEYDIDPTIDELNQGLTMYRVLMTVEGDTKEIEKVEGISSVRSFSCTTVRNDLNMSVWAKDETHAVKIVNEKRLQRIAENNWKH
jgi:hypothetical protein